MDTWINGSYEKRGKVEGRVTDLLIISRNSYLPSSRQSEIVDSISVILWCDITIPRDVIDHRLVLTTVTKRQFLGLCPRGKGKQLITQANTKNGFQ